MTDGSQQEAGETAHTVAPVAPVQHENHRQKYLQLVGFAPTIVPYRTTMIRLIMARAVTRAQSQVD